MGTEVSGRGTTGIDESLNVHEVPYRVQPADSGTASSADGRGGGNGKAEHVTVLEGGAAEAVMQVLGQDEVFRVLSSAVARAKTIREVSIEQDLPLSSAYRMVDHLVKCGLMLVESRVFSETGKKHATYRSAITYLGVTMVDGAVAVEVRLNAGAIERLNSRMRSIWDAQSREIRPGLHEAHPRQRTIALGEPSGL